MNPFLAIALIGLALKVWAGYRLHRHWRFGADRIWLLLFLITCYLQTAVEVFGYLYFFNASAKGLMLTMHAYYLLVIATVIIFPFSVATAVRKSIHPWLATMAIVLYAVFAYALLNTDLIVQGYKPYGYLATRIAGQYYWIFQSMTITSMLICVSLLVQSYRHSENEIIRIKSANLLIGFLPFSAVLAGIIVAMRMGSGITAAGILPLLISVYVVVLAENLRSDRLLDLRAYLPWTNKARLLRRLTRPLREAGLSHDRIRELAEAYRLELEHQNRRVRQSSASPAASPEAHTSGTKAVQH